MTTTERQVFASTVATMGGYDNLPSTPMPERPPLTEVTVTRMFFGLKFQGHYFKEVTTKPSIFKHVFMGDYEPNLFYDPGDGSWTLADSGGDDCCGFESKANEATFLRWLTRKVGTWKQPVKV